MQNFLTASNNNTKDSYIWNAIASFLFAFQSVILLVVLTRTVGLIDSGIFTIAYANGSLFLLIGKYGVRNYQVSDIKRQCSFGEYRLARILTTGMMLAVSFGYVLYNTITNGYSMEKSLVILLVCILKIPDAIEDVYFGEYQRCGRLDVAAKAMACRLGLTLIVFSAVVIITNQLVLALVVAVLFTFSLMYVFLKKTVVIFELEYKIDKHSVIKILRECFPLFTGMFLSQYIVNAPKYAIDAQLSDDLQACYGFISMPVFVISLLNGFIFNPAICKMSKLWFKKEKGAFLKRVSLQIVIVAIITILCIIGAKMVGIPVLSLIYNTDLHLYKGDLLILLLGGGFLALSGLLSTVITIMRFQKMIFWGYGIVALGAALLSRKVVSLYGITGASWLYLLLMCGTFLCFLIFFVLGLVRNDNAKR